MNEACSSASSRVLRGDGQLGGGEEGLRLAFDANLDCGCERGRRQHEEDERQENEALGHDSSFREGIGMEGDRQVF